MRFNNSVLFAATIFAATANVALAQSDAIQASTEVSSDPIQTFYVPLPEASLFNDVFVPINDEDAVAPVNTLISIAVSTDNTIIYYDHWEDNYDSTFTQSTTEIWGDGDSSNGCSPMINNCNNANDVLNAGDVIVLENQVPVPRGTAVLYDGGDCIQANFPIAMTRAAYPEDPGSLMAGAVEIIEEANWGTDFVAPVGQDTIVDTKAYQYVGMAVMSGSQGNVCRDGDGGVLATLNQGESTTIIVNQGNEIICDAPVQVHLITGDRDSTYELRWYALTPTEQWSDEYYAAVGDTEGSTKLTMYNDNDFAITVTVTTQNGSTNINVPAKSEVRSDVIPDGTGAKLTSNNKFWAFSSTDTESKSGQIFDWGYPLMTKEQLTNVALVGLGYGCTDNNCDSDGERSVVWITPVADADIHVDYNNDGNAVTIEASALESLILTDEGDEDMSGAIIWATEPGSGVSGPGVNIAAAWGQKASFSKSNDNDALDLGTVIVPFEPIRTECTVEMVEDNDGNREMTPGDEVLQTITVLNSGPAAIGGGTLVVDTLAGPYTIDISEGSSGTTTVEVTYTIPEGELVTTDCEIIPMPPSAAPSDVPSVSPTGMPSASPSKPPTGNPTASPSGSPSASPSSPPTGGPTPSPSGSPSAPPTGTPTASPSESPSDKPTGMPNAEPSASPSSPPTGGPTASPSAGPSATPSAPPTGIPSASPSDKPTGTPNSEPSSTPSVSPSSTPTASPSGTPSATPSAPPTGIPSSSPSDKPTGTPNSEPSATPSVSPSAKPSVSPSGTPSAKPSASPSGVPSVSPSAPPTGTPNAEPTPSPSESPSDKPSVSPSGSPSAKPSVSPSGSPSSTPSYSPSGMPSSSPSMPPTGTPNSDPTPSPSVTPSAPPSIPPSASPSTTPSVSPSGTPSASPSAPPTGTPNSEPTPSPSQTPSAKPSVSPSGTPSATPSVSPSGTPSATPSAPPTGTPNSEPTATPSVTPSAPPSAVPSAPPTGTPNSEPTATPSVTPSAPPSAVPSAPPTGTPNSEPTATPSQTPSSTPSVPPTGTPSSTPSAPPTGTPNAEPTATPSQTPSNTPSAPPTGTPTASPSGAPSETTTPRTPPPVTQPPKTPAPSPRGSGSGDPHFKTWTGEKYDYHGECDLVLVHDPNFADGLGMRLHIRTTRVKFFSFIEKVALQIGNDVLEFDNDAQNFLINGRFVEANRKHHKTMLGPYIIRRDPKAISVRLSGGMHGKNTAKIDFHTRKNGFPAIIVDAGHTDIFKGSLGLLGEWGTGRKLGRDGKKEFVGINSPDDDATEFALEWQVRDDEPMLFNATRLPQFPTQCTPPAPRPAGRLGGSLFRKEAEEACSHWKHDKDDCIFDVMATRDILVAEEGHIVHVE